MPIIYPGLRLDYKFATHPVGGALIHIIFVIVVIVSEPLNVMGAHFRSFAQLLVPRLTELDIGVFGMKTLGGADGVILKSKTVEPLECLHYSPQSSHFGSDYRHR